ncbi:MAG: Adenine glycosylase [Betaproteobacteria bacterium]|nr:Adenine glycosylase [Betaproteobacteria bacterium]
MQWQQQHGRHDLPWQNTRNAYRIWLSEIMLQQTQVSTVIPYYRRFLDSFPDIRSLAVAPEDDVLARWSGLGYYSRARNLHRAAQIMVASHAACVPQEFEALLQLPGIGRSTAAAISVFAFGARHAILDGNVKRLFARRFGIAGFPGDARVMSALWQETERQLPKLDIESYTQGLMDLGATVCTRSKPRCDLCPVAPRCVARKSDAISKYPEPRPKKILPQRQIQMLVLLHAKQVLLEKRPPTGIWGGLWSLPEAVAGTDIKALCAQRYGATVTTHEEMAVVAHGFTHFKLDIAPQRLGVSRIALRAAAPGLSWLTLEDALDAAIPTPVKRILLKVIAG